MGVMLQRDTQSQRLYLHSVVSLAMKEEATSSSQADRVANGALEDDNHLFMTSILQKAVDVKRFFEKGSVKKSRKANPQTSGKAAAKDPEVEHLKGMQRQTVARYARAKVYVSTSKKGLLSQSLCWWRSQCKHCRESEPRRASLRAASAARCSPLALLAAQNQFSYSPASCAELRHPPSPPAKKDCFRSPFAGGDKGSRTPDLLNAIQALSQLSYTPMGYRRFSQR